MVDKPNLFSSLQYVVHVPSLYLQKLLNPYSIRNDTFLVFHPYSVSFIEASSYEAEVLRMVEEGIPLKKIVELKGKDSINVIKQAEEVIRDLKPREVIRFDKPTVLWLLTTPYCNLRCRYCYTASGFAFKSSERLLTTDEIVNAIDKILEAFPSINHIAFFGGGEPLLRLDIIERVSTVFEDRVKDYSIVTNATLINKRFLDLLISYRGRFWVTVSIDGPKEINDINRVYPDGRGTFNDVVKGIEALRENSIPFDIQATYTREAMVLGYSMSDIAYYLSKFSPYIMLRPSDYVVTLGAGMRYEDSLLGFVLGDYVATAIEELSRVQPKFYDLVIAINVAQLGRKAVKLDACPFTSFITLNADGRIFTCHMLVDFVLGKYSKISLNELRDRYGKAIQMLRRYTERLDPREYWMLTLQDICPAELFGGITVAERKGSTHVKPYVRSMLENYWDFLLIKVFKLYLDGNLNRVYDNIAELLRMRREGLVTRHGL